MAAHVMFFLGQQQSRFSTGGLVGFMPMLVLVGLILLAVYWTRRRARRRSAEWEERAGSLGLSSWEQGGQLLLGRLAGFELFSQGTNRKIENLLQGERHQASVTVFDYRYATGTGKRAQTHRQSVICFQVRGVDLPPFAVRPTGPFHQLNESNDYQAITVASAPTFSKKFLMRGADEAAVLVLWHGDGLRFMERQSSISCEGRGDQLIYYRQRQRINADQLDRFLTEGIELLALFARIDTQVDDGDTPARNGASL